MGSPEELRAHRESLLVSRARGVTRVSYDGKTVDYRSLAEIDRAIEALDRASAENQGSCATQRHLVSSADR